jgi:hypothetical protein
LEHNGNVIGSLPATIFPVTVACCIILLFNRICLLLSYRSEQQQHVEQEDVLKHEINDVNVDVDVDVDVEIGTLEIKQYISMSEFMCQYMEQ